MRNASVVLSFLLALAPLSTVDGRLMAACGVPSVPASSNAATTATTIKRDTQTAASAPQRLPLSVTPIRYDLFIDPDLKLEKFAGEESIVVRVDARTDKIVLNSVELKVTGASIFAKNEKRGETPVGSMKIKSEGETIVMSSPRVLDPGIYRLYLSFKGKLNEKLCGFYRATATDAKGKQVTIATTQMEPTDARRMFPCFDEPAMKAVFKLSVRVDGENTAISNGQIAKEVKEASGRRLITFADTPRMSTYLVTLIVGPFQSTQPVVANGVPIRVWALKGESNLGVYARNVAEKLMPFYINYFGCAYPGRKLDLIAIPEFEAGAMENLGAITFREEALLVDDKRASIEMKRRVAWVIAHEMAHLWFGDLVTMQWWDDLWLNEAFATWMAVKAIDYFRPDWRPWVHTTSSRLGAMDTDSLRASRAIHADVANPAQAIEMFDGITYEKGASILRMLETFVGEKVFQKGVQRYIKAHAFGNATTSNLWESIAEVSDQPIKEIMRSWVYTPGFPVVTLSRNENKLLLSQERFIMDGGKETSNSIWSVPVNWRKLGADDKTTGNMLLSETKGTLTGADAETQVLLNAGANGYYRVRYPSEFVSQISDETLSKLSVSERLTLLNDQWALTFAGLSPISDYLKLTSKFADESESEVIQELVEELSALNSLIADQDRPHFEKCVRDRLGKIASRLGWKSAPTESDLTRFARVDVLRAMGTFGADPATIKEARKLFAESIKDPKSVDPNLMVPIMTIVAYNGDSRDYERISELWKKARTPEDRVRNLMCLALFREPHLIERTLQLTIGKELRLQDAPNLLCSVLSTEAGRRPGWAFVKMNWKRINELYPMPTIPHVVSSADSMMTAADLKDVKDFVSQHPIPAGARKIAQTVERLRNRVKFHERITTELAKLPQQ